ncbi:Hypothetical predicted protein [Octopus vulgaris]|uniref:Uncharacterized protein n=1 Tax=Octopus vulgaris TaxID=6645 RepID=A0AA36BF82_OCTVU|nr:Hypothetical predicted protein [Octopus vulgaris]
MREKNNVTVTYAIAVGGGCHGDAGGGNISCGGDSGCSGDICSRDALLMMLLVGEMSFQDLYISDVLVAVHCGSGDDRHDVLHQKDLRSLENWDPSLYNPDHPFMD